MITKVPTLSYKEFLTRYPTEKNILDLIVKAKYRGTFICPKCGSMHNICRQKYDARKLYCFNKDCKSEFSILDLTMFKYTHVDLRIWFYIIYLLKIEKINLPALQLQKMVATKSYKSIYRIKNTIVKTLAKQKDTGEYDPEIITEFIADFC